MAMSHWGKPTHTLSCVFAATLGAAPWAGAGLPQHNAANGTKIIMQYMPFSSWFDVGSKIEWQCLTCPTGTPSERVATAGGLALLATQSSPATRSDIVPVPCAAMLGFHSINTCCSTSPVWHTNLESASAIGA